MLIKIMSRKIVERIKEGGVKIRREKILGYLKDHDSVTSRALTLLNLESPQARKILRNMVTDGILIAQKKLEQ